MNHISPGDNDVVSMRVGYGGFMPSGTFKVKDFLSALSEECRLKLEVMNFFKPIGAECEILQASGGGWRKGKLRFRLEFIPDDEAPGAGPLPLDELREQFKKSP